MFPDRRGPDGPNPTATPAGASVVVALLGEVALRRDDGLTPVPGTRSRLLLTALALRPGRSRSAPALIEDVWAERPPRSPMNALHTQVSRLRSALPDGALEIGPAGYRLAFAPEQVDLTLGGELLARARRELAAADFAACLDSVRTARALWRGEPGADLPPGELAEELIRTASSLATELDEAELTAREASGDLRGALHLARHRCAADPLDEPAQLDLMRLLARADRPNEALESFAAFRTRLADHLGADPGRALVELNTAILRGELIGGPTASELRAAASWPGGAVATGLGGAGPSEPGGAAAGGLAGPAANGPGDATASGVAGPPANGPGDATASGVAGPPANGPGDATASGVADPLTNGPAGAASSAGNAAATGPHGAAASGMAGPPTNGPAGAAANGPGNAAATGPRDAAASGFAGPPTNGPAGAGASAGGAAASGFAGSPATEPAGAAPSAGGAAPTRPHDAAASGFAGPPTNEPAGAAANGPGNAAPTGPHDAAASELASPPTNGPAGAAPSAGGAAPTRPHDAAASGFAGPPTNEPAGAAANGPGNAAPTGPHDAAASELASPPTNGPAGAAPSAGGAAASAGGAAATGPRDAVASGLAGPPANGPAGAAASWPGGAVANVRDHRASTGTGAFASVDSTAQLQESDGAGLPAPRDAIGLRAAPNALLGRDGDLDELVGLLRAARVVTVLGPGGTGKTRVANEVGARVARRESVVLVELASVRSTSVADARADIESAISTTLGIGEVVREPGLLRQGRIDTGRRLRDALSARPMLLILDNCEHLIDAVAEVVADLIGSCEQLTVLTTSRAPLAISAESVYPLAPLAIDAAGSPATDLFSARARAVRPTVRLDPDAVARLCAMLDGLPLAIELAAARVRTMSVEEIESRLEHRFALLRGGDRSSPERHRTLHAVIAWSWNLLDPPQQATLRRMCRFPAGFTLPAAESVAGGADVDDVTAAVDGLVGQSLLTVLEDEGGTRYRMLETVREFGEEQLTAADEGELVMRRMSRWASEYAVAAARRYRTDDQVSTVLSVGAELDNLVAVLRHALDRGDSATVYRVFPVAAMLWMMRGAHLELTSWAPRVLRLTPEPGPARGVVADLRMLASVVIGLHMIYLNSDLRPMAAVRSRARTLLRTAVDMNPGLRLLGDLLIADASGKGVARKLAEGARSPDPDVRAAALIARANLRENQGDVHGSARDSLGALRLVEPADLWGTAMVCQHLGQLGGQTARYAESVDYYRRAVEALRILRAHEEIVEIRSYLAVALIGIGRVDQARAELSFALDSSDDPAHVQPIDDPNIRRNHRLATVAAGVAELALAEGDIDAGMRYYRRSLNLLGWPEDDLTPGPGGLMLAGAMVGAHVLYGRVDAATELAAELAAGAAGRLAQYYDLPQIGAVACGVGSYLLAVDPGSDLGMELLALAAKVVARQDYPSMMVERHLELHRPRVGAERMSAALRSAAALRRRTGAARIIALLREFSGAPGD
ncbi:AfsR/SARP family transcriptional regulator [Nocardia amikacinitolerans]|uniref:AfsR/SARP family transcriptional regulator n=1 Tax=Nocardia amikacinitolerans TaxID=756689 RepID=UPI0020A2534D|nr:BTAD domain-containing putative transcriptional regulator [Nocardia amikacinitolerans]